MVVALSDLTLLGGSVLPAGCYTLFSDYNTLFKSAGNAAIATAVNQYVTPNVSKDVNTVLVVPATTFVQAEWANYLSANIPQDLPNNAIVSR